MKEYICKEEPVYDLDCNITDYDLSIITELIRCKDCKHWQYESCFAESEEGDADSIILDRFAFDFCSRAERRNDETD